MQIIVAKCLFQPLNSVKRKSIRSLLHCFKRKNLKAWCPPIVEVRTFVHLFLSNAVEISLISIIDKSLPLLSECREDPSRWMMRLAPTSCICETRSTCQGNMIKFYVAFSSMEENSSRNCIMWEGIYSWAIAFMGMWACGISIAHILMSWRWSQTWNIASSLSTMSWKSLSQSHQKSRLSWSFGLSLGLYWSIFWFFGWADVTNTI